MPRIKDQKFETFNDGTLTVCKTANRTIVETRQAGVRFGNRTVGIKRFWEAKVLSQEVNRLISVPAGVLVEKNDILIIFDQQYSILQIQEKFDTFPPCRYLSLSSMPIKMKDVRT